MAEQRALERIAQLAAKEEDEREQDARLETLRKSTRRRLGIGMDFFIFGRETSFIFQICISYMILLTLTVLTALLLFEP